MEPAKLKVLIVDDNHLNLRVIKQILKTKLSAFLDLESLQTADSGAQALELLRTHHFHLLFLDISMPGISGLEVSQTLRNDSSHPSSKIHICAVTTDLADCQIQLYKSLAMDGVIGKPLKSLDLEFAIKACLQSIIYQEQPHLSCPPPFYFRRHGTQQLLPELLLSPIHPTPLDHTHCSSPTSSTLPSSSSSSIGLQPVIRSPSPNSHPRFRQQSVVSETSVAAVLASQDPSPFLRTPRPCFDQLDLIDETLISDCRPSFDSFDTISTSGSIITCSSLGPNSATTIEPVSPSYCSEHEPFGHSKRFPAFPTAPILTSTHLSSGLRSPRRWSSPLYSLGSPPADSLFVREENDVFAAGFEAALNHMTTDQACTRWGKDCLSATTPPTHVSMYSHLEGDPEEDEASTTIRNLASWKSEDDVGKERVDVNRQNNNLYQWARLAGPISCDDSSKLSSVTRQLISRRSHPTLRLDHLDRSRTCSAEPSPTGLRVEPDLESPFMRKSKSAAGLPIRPSWQLVQLSAINYQSILKSGNLLDEVLFGLDLEDSI